MATVTLAAIIEKTELFALRFAMWTNHTATFRSITIPLNKLRVLGSRMSRGMSAQKFLYD
jgi:hypothetical protein